jgi:Fe-Mn family superoxide dismutase
MSDRRDFFKKGGLLGLSFLASKFVNADQLKKMEALGAMGTPAFQLPKLPYEYDAMEPYIDKQTMEIHHSKHHAAYVNKLNDTPSTDIDYTMDDAGKCRQINKTTAAVIRNNLGGHYNHSLFWLMLRSNKEGKTNLPTGTLSDAIARDFKNFEDFKKEFSEKALKVFGSGWCWLIEQEAGPDDPVGRGKLKVITTPNQDNPLMDLDGEKGKIVLALDVWEHAYYLKYQNKRVDYIANWWNIVNWEKSQELFTSK